MTRLPKTETSMISNMKFSKMKLPTLLTFLYCLWWILKRSSLYRGVRREFSFTRLVELSCFASSLFHSGLDSSKFLNIYCRLRILYPLQLGPPFPNDGSILKPKISLGLNQMKIDLKKVFMESITYFWKNKTIFGKERL